MKLGFGLYRQMLNTDNFRFAKQAGATHIVAHLTDYFNAAESLSTASGSDAWGITQNQEKPWTYDELQALQNAVRAEGLELAALENFDPSHWYDVLLDGPQKEKQIEGLKKLIRNMGKAEIGVMGYNFSIAGVWGRTETYARGHAPSVGMEPAILETQTPIPNGEVWNMVYDPDASAGTVAPISAQQMWERLRHFLQELTPVAEEAGVMLALHPDDPPLAELRGGARLVVQPERYQQVLDLVPSKANGLEMCLGTLSEMPQSEFDDFYGMVDHYAKQHCIGYIHCRNVVGKAPDYREVFIDEGDIDMVRVLRILHKNNYNGVIIPDHTPQMSCEAPWHAGMAYAMGYLKAAIQIIEQE